MAISNWFHMIIFGVAIFSCSAITLKQNSKEHQNHETPQDINVLAAVLPPFTYFNSSHGFYDGIDVRLLDTIAKRLHLKLVFTKADDFAHIPVREFRKYDLIIGGICPGDVNFGKFEASAPYQQDDITWCVSHAQPIPRWMNLLHIADLPTIALSLVGIVIVIGLVYLLNAFEDRPGDLIFCIISSLQTLIQISTTFRVQRFSNRFLFGMMLLNGFWLTTTFGAYAIVFMGQELYETQIATIQDIVDEDYHLAGNPNVIDHFKVKNVFTQEQIRDFETCINIDECLQRLKDDHQLAVATSRLHVNTLSIQDNIFCFDRYENIYDCSSVIMIRNNFPLKSRLVNILDAIIAAGFIARWEKDFQRYSHERVQILEDRPIFMSDLWAVVAYIVIFMFLSVAAFIAEFVIYYQSRSESQAERHYYINLFWDLCDKCICGSRQFFLLGQRDFITDIIFGILNWILNWIYSRVAAIRPTVEKFWNAVVVPGIYFSAVLFVFLNVFAVIAWIIMKYYFDL